MKNISTFLNTFGERFSIKRIVKALIPLEGVEVINKLLNKNSKIRIYSENNLLVVDRKNNRVQGLSPVFYWDDAPNFGDVIGPFLISKITGKPVLNIYRNDFTGLMTVGSILQEVDRSGMAVWGSGLIERPSEALISRIKYHNPEILSVRGKETEKILSEAGIAISDGNAFGDPALLLPLFYNAEKSRPEGIGFCPHYIHKSLFPASLDEKEGFKIIDVQKDMKSVVDEIASAGVCVSTSLHGLIIAQAYGVPWVWLEIIDNNLVGDDFKFKDFFSTINDDQVAHVKVQVSEVGHLDYVKIAENATLPDKLYDEKLILGVLNKYLDE